MPWEEARKQSTPEELAKPGTIFQEQYCVRGRKAAPVPMPEQVGGRALCRGCRLALLWFFMNRGSVLPRAGGGCRARSHRSCQAVPEPHAARLYREQRTHQERSMGERRLREDRAARNTGKSS